MRNTTKRIPLLNQYKVLLCSTLAFLLGCMFTLSITPLDKTCISEKSGFNSITNYKLKDPELIILILSAPKNLERRQNVRKTWLTLNPMEQDSTKDNKFKVKHFFAIGHSNLNKDKMRDLEREQAEFKDLLFLPMQDSYANLTLKILKSFEWLHEQFDHNLKFKYVLKCDDDSFIRLDSLVHELKHIELLYLKSKLSSVKKMAEENNSPYLRINTQINSYETRNNLSLYWGYFDGRATMRRKGKWKDQNWIACDKYIPYALGGGYILSKSLVSYIAKNRDDLRLFNAEDVSIGFWLSTVNNIIRIHDIRFDTEWTSRGCQNYYLVSHNIPPDTMQEMISNIQSHKILCTNPHLNRNFYHYNWSSPPSQCCKIK